LKHIILDTDPGVDDALAFLLAFSSPELAVEAVTTVAGNVSHEKGHRNAKQLLEFLGRTDVPVCRGAVRPLVRELRHAEEVHGETGLGGASLPKPEMGSDHRNAVQMIHFVTDRLSQQSVRAGLPPVAVAVLSANSKCPWPMNRGEQTRKRQATLLHRNSALGTDNLRIGKHPALRRVLADREIDGRQQEIYADLLLRKPGADELSSPRKEPDLPVIYSGVNAADTIVNAKLGLLFVQV